MAFARRRLAALLTLCAISGASAASEAGLVNPGFENRGKRPPKGCIRYPAAGWRSALSSGSAYGDAVLSDDAHSGKHALEMRVKTDDPKKYFMDTSQPLPARPGQKVTVTYWCKRKNGLIYGGGYLRFYDAKAKRLKPQGNAGFHLTEKWRKYIMRAVTPENARTMEIRFCVFGRVPAKGASVLYDDVELRFDTKGLLENGRLRVRVDPVCGGRIRSFVLKTAEGPREFVKWQGLRAGGFAETVIPSDRVSSFTGDLPFKLETLKPLRTLRLAHRLALSGKGKTGFNGLRIVKTLDLPPGASRLDIELKLVNESGKRMEVPLRERFCLVAADATWSWPFTDWLKVMKRSLKQPTMNFTTALGKGWVGLTRADGAALTTVFDVAGVDRAYSYLSPNIDTLEWYRRPVSLPAGGEWRTTYSVCAFEGRGAVFAADRAFVLTADADATTIRSVNAYAVGPERRGDLRVAGRPVALSPETGAATEAVNSPLAKALDVVARAGGSELSGEVGGTGRGRLRYEKAVALPEPPKRGDLPEVFYTFFPFFAEADWLYYVEGSGGRPTYRNYMTRLARDMRYHHFNGIQGGRTCEARRLRSLLDAKGRNVYLEAARRYGLFIVPRYPLLHKTEKDTRKRFWEPMEKRGYVFVPEFRDLCRRYPDRIVFFDLSDEPSPRMIPEMLKVIAAARKELPNLVYSPIVNLVLHQFAPYVPIYFGDRYPIKTPAYGGRNPWAISPDVRAAVKAAGTTPVWLMPQGFGRWDGSGKPADYRIPTGEETRLMLYAAVANGAKGILYHGFGRLSWRYKYWYHDPIYDNAGAYTAAFDAASAVARQLTAVGPALLRTSPEDGFTGARVTCKELSGKSYGGPALKLTVLKSWRGKGRFLCAQNQDITSKQSGGLYVARSRRGDALLDLFNVKRLDPAKPVGLSLAPADMVIYFLGPKGEAEKVWQKVRAQRALNTYDRLRIDADRAAANTVDVAGPTKLADRAKRAAKAGRGDEAGRLMSEARAALSDALKATSLPRTLSIMAQTRRRLSETAWLFRRRFGIVAPPKVRAATGKNRRYRNTEDPAVQAAVDAVAEDFTAYWRLERELWEGRRKNALKDATALHEKVEADARRARAVIEAAK